jgi:uncharacterized membrane protein HdeD (DUF308 family)
MYCPTTPVIIALLTLISPRVNTIVLRQPVLWVIVGLFNVLSYFNARHTLWNLVLHTPPYSSHCTAWQSQP